MTFREHVQQELAEGFLTKQQAEDEIDQLVEYGLADMQICGPYDAYSAHVNEEVEKLD